VGEWEACDFEGNRVTGADGDFEHEPCYSMTEIIEPCNLGAVSGEPGSFGFLKSRQVEDGAPSRISFSMGGRSAGLLFSNAKLDILANEGLCNM
jgi:hypothetical protein